jgi:hypothetical protein
MSDSSWTAYDSDDESRITFDLPATDPELVDQVFDFIHNNPNADIAETLLKIARKYRFAGYIGAIDYLFVEIEELKETVDDLRKEINFMREEKRVQWSIYNLFKW